MEIIKIDWHKINSLPKKHSAFVCVCVYKCVVLSFEVHDFANKSNVIGRMKRVTVDGMRTIVNGEKYAIDKPNTTDQPFNLNR